jgi:hypothetical protein
LGGFLLAIGRLLGKKPGLDLFHDSLEKNPHEPQKVEEHHPKKE